MRDEEFVSKQYPIIQTGNVSNIDSNGVRFTGEFLNLGSSEIMEYGFVFGDIDPKIEYSNKIIIESKAKVGKFSQYIEKNIAGNINYNVKAYAKTSDYIIYGNNIVFTSTGSKYNPWDLVLHASIYGWFDLHGFSNNELGFILFQSGHFYSYNPKTNSIVKKQNSPIDGNSGTIFASFGLGSNLYVISNISSSVFVYDSENNQWSNLGKSPFSTNGGFLGFSINNNGYFLSRNYFYSYNKSTGTWLKKTNIPSAHLSPACPFCSCTDVSILDYSKKVHGRPVVSISIGCPKCEKYGLSAESLQQARDNWAEFVKQYHEWQAMPATAYEKVMLNKFFGRNLGSEDKNVLADRAKSVCGYGAYRMTTCELTRGETIWTKMNKFSC